MNDTSETRADCGIELFFFSFHFDRLGRQEINAVPATSLLVVNVRIHRRDGIRFVAGIDQNCLSTGRLRRRIHLKRTATISWDSRSKSTSTRWFFIHWLPFFLSFSIPRRSLVCCQLGYSVWLPGFAEFFFFLVSSHRFQTTFDFSLPTRVKLESNGEPTLRQVYDVWWFRLMGQFLRHSTNKHAARPCTRPHSGVRKNRSTLPALAVLFSSSND